MGKGSFKVVKNKRHVVVLGVASVTVLTEFIVEVLRKDKHYGSTLHVVVMTPDMEVFQEHVANVNLTVGKRRVTFLQGSASSIHDLIRAGVHACKAVFFINKNSGVSSLVPAEIYKLNVDGIGLKTSYPDVPVFQIHNHATAKIRLSSAFVTPDFTIKQSLLRTKTLARSANAPGFSTLMYNLVKANTEDQMKEILARHEALCEYNIAAHGKSRQTKVLGWFDEYFHGAAHRLSREHLPKVPLHIKHETTYSYIVPIFIFSC